MARKKSRYCPYTRGTIMKFENGQWKCKDIEFWKQDEFWGLELYFWLASNKKPITSKNIRQYIYGKTKQKT